MSNEPTLVGNIFFLKVVRVGYDVKPLDFGAFQHCNPTLVNLYIKNDNLKVLAAVMMSWFFTFNLFVQE